jgi:hypothetical protein
LKSLLTKSTLNNIRKHKEGSYVYRLFDVGSAPQP